MKGGREIRVTLCRSPVSSPNLGLPRECSYVQNPGKTSSDSCDSDCSVYAPGLVSNVCLWTEIYTAYSKLFDISSSLSCGLPTEMQGVNELH